MANLRKKLGLDKKKTEPSVAQPVVVEELKAREASPNVGVKSGKGKKPKVEPPRHSCGHAAQLLNACPLCRDKSRQERRHRKRKKRQVEGPSRLPDGAVFDLHYNAGSTTWTGTLTIGASIFTGSASAVFKLLRKLDQAYRQAESPTP